MDAWNRQCDDKPSRVIIPGDLIIMVNGITNSSEMVLECRQNLKLRLLFSLRASAQEFRPVEGSS